MAPRQASWMLLASCLLAQAFFSSSQLDFEFGETTPGAYNYLSVIHPRTVLWLDASPTAQSSAADYGAFICSVRGADLFKNASPDGALARVRLRAQVRWERVLGSSAWAGLFVRADGDLGFVRALDNMRDRPLKGTTSGSSEDSVEQTVVIDVPQDAAVGGVIRAGLFLCGGFGTVWMRDVQLEEVGVEVPVTGGPPPWSGPLSL